MNKSNTNPRFKGRKNSFVLYANIKYFVQLVEFQISNGVPASVVLGLGIS